MEALILIGIAVLIGFYLHFDEQKEIKELKKKYKTDQQYKIWKENQVRKIKKFYKSYIKSKTWNEIKNKRMELDNYHCVKCRSQLSLVCHHITYKNLGNEKINDITTLCQECHQSIHDVVGYPQTYDCYKVRVFWN